jgi:hypothetical protein
MRHYGEAGAAAASAQHSAWHGFSDDTAQYVSAHALASAPSGGDAPDATPQGQLGAGAGADGASCVLRPSSADGAARPAAPTADGRPASAPQLGQACSAPVAAVLAPSCLRCLEEHPSPCERCDLRRYSSCRAARSRAPPAGARHRPRARRRQARALAALVRPQRRARRLPLFVAGLRRAISSHPLPRPRLTRARARTPRADYELCGDPGKVRAPSRRRAPAAGGPRQRPRSNRSRRRCCSSHPRAPLTPPAPYPRRKTARRSCARCCAARRSGQTRFRGLTLRPPVRQRTIPRRCPCWRPS